MTVISIVIAIRTFYAQNYTNSEKTRRNERSAQRGGGGCTKRRNSSNFFFTSLLIFFCFTESGERVVQMLRSNDSNKFYKKNVIVQLTGFPKFIHLLCLFF